MKPIKISILLLMISFTFTSCLKDHCKQKMKMFIPVYKSRDAVLRDVKLLASRSMEKPGKIFSYGNYLFINEIDKGIHIIDNSNPSSPAKIGFLNIAGNLDLWIKDNLLYADCYDNLLVLDISNIHNITLAESVPTVFRQREYDFNSDLSKGYIVGWDERDTTLAMDCNNNGNVYMKEDVRGGVLLSASGSGSSFTPPAGIAGSLTRFNITGNYLYCLDAGLLHTFNISARNPAKAADIDVSWNVETIYSFNNNLFIGTSNGVLIYSLSNPAAPSYVNKMEHVRTCDPVITDGHYAFLTLRGGSPCGGFTNQMDVLDVSNLQSVSLLKSYSLTSPYGLGMNSNYVFVCDDSYGIRVFDRGDVLQMNEISKVNADHPRDIILLSNVLLVITDTKMLQFDYSDIKNIKQISELN
jgi:hypothetical protein